MKERFSHDEESILHDFHMSLPTRFSAYKKWIMFSKVCTKPNILKSIMKKFG